MTGLRRRTATAIVYAGVVLAAILAPLPVFGLLLAVALVLAGRELTALRRAGGVVAIEGALLIAGLASLFGLRAAGATLNAHGWDPTVPAWLFLAILPTWAADVAAYAVGSVFGRRKLAPRISPGKTWEGTIGGFFAAAIAAFGVGAFFGLPRASVALVVVAIGPVALAGDLFESYLKRRVGAKDSGALLPGHGGVLDRIDGLIAVAPLVAVALYLASSLG
ncbi:MAG: phosphatidate cytidylyltransferase [Chloroflexi bacterium]|nr:phosphatidate cytidylyltransferase [Chloroflexota bacterium]